MNTITNWIVGICCVVILMTSLGAVGTCGRERAREAVCVSNLRTLLDAWLLYPDDHDGKLVSAQTSDQSSWVSYPKQFALEDRLEGISRALYIHMPTNRFKARRYRVGSELCVSNIPESRLNQ